MKKIIKNAIKVASLVSNKKGLATTGTIVAAGALGLVGLLPSRPEAVVMDNFVHADEIEIVKKGQEPSQDDFILADEVENVEEEVEEEVEENIEEIVEEVEVETVEEVEVEVEAEDTQNLAPENNTAATQTNRRVPQQTNQSQPVNNNTGQEEREAEARRAAARQEEREAEARRAEAARQEKAEAQKRAKEEAQKRAEEEARKAAEAAKLAEMAKVVADNHNKPNLLLRNGVVVKEGSGRVWYYDGPVDGLSFTDDSGNEIKRNVQSVTVNESLYDVNGVNYSNYMNGRVAPVVIQTTEVGYVLHIFTR